MPRHDRSKLLRWVVPLLLLAIWCSVPGCTGDVQKAIDNVKKVAKSAADEIAAAGRPEKGQIEISHNPPIKTDRVFGSFGVFPQASSVLVIRSYERELDDDPGEETRTSSYPMVLVRATTKSKSLRDLVGKKIPAHVSIQYAGTFPAFSSEGGHPVEIEITEGDEYYVKAKLTGVSLPEVGGGRKLPCDGTLTALFAAPLTKPAAAPAESEGSDERG
jgi:hypothetical protein